MLRMIWIRIALSIPLVFVITGMTFILMNMLSGNAATQVLGVHATTQLIGGLEAEWGLDKPIYVQYGKWLGRVVKGDLGTSTVTNEPVTAILKKRIAVSLNLLFGAMLVSAEQKSQGTGNGAGRGSVMPKESRQK